MALSIVIITIIENQNHFGTRARYYQNRNEPAKLPPRAEAEKYVTSIIKLNILNSVTRDYTPPRFTVGAATNTPACQQEALPARYRRTASLSTYTDTMLPFFEF
jgi:hypothetical protein